MHPRRATRVVRPPPATAAFPTFPSGCSARLPVAGGRQHHVVKKTPARTGQSVTMLREQDRHCLHPLPGPVSPARRSWCRYHLPGPRTSRPGCCRAGRQAPRQTVRNLDELAPLPVPSELRPPLSSHRRPRAASSASSNSVGLGCRMPSSRLMLASRSHLCMESRTLEERAVGGASPSPCTRSHFTDASWWYMHIWWFTPMCSQPVVSRSCTVIPWNDPRLCA